MSRFGSAFSRVLSAAFLAAACLAASGPLVRASAQSTPLVFQSISAGTSHACGITAQHVAYCWGRNSDGQLGNPAVTAACSDAGTPCSSKPVRVEGGLSFAVISAGNDFTCGVTTVGTAYCWGAGALAQLGDGEQTSTSRPVRVASEGVTFQTISAGDGHACAVSTSGAAYCWGSNTGGRLGTDASLTGGHTIPAPVAGGLLFRSISAGYYHSCGVTRAGAVYCWGRNELGEAGAGGTSPHPKPARVEGSLAATLVSAGVQFDYSCAVARDGSLYCWGANCYGQLGVDSTTEQCGTPAMPCSSTPKAVHASGRFLSVGGSFTHACALDSAGVISCWGENNEGQLGNGAETVSIAGPAPVRGGATYKALAVGRQFTCGITADGAAQCWGRNSEGQLGTGDTERKTIPTAVVGP